jgi:hypothetical protein
MGSTFFGDTVAADFSRRVTSRQIVSDRGIDGRAASCA